MKKKNYWPAGIAVIYIGFVLALVVFVVYSRYQQVNLVTEDYYSKELRYQNQIDRIQRADSLSTPVRWHYDETQKDVTIQFPSDLDTGRLSGHVLFFRPSDAGQDRVVPLNLSPDASQKISTANLTTGLWKLKIYWKIEQTDYYQESALIIK